MQDEVLRLFHEVDDLTPAERRRYFERHNVPPDLQAELEALLHFDSPDRHNHNDCTFGSYIEVEHA